MHPIYRTVVTLLSTERFLYRVSELEVYKNTCLYFSTQKLYAIYVFKSVQCNPKRFLCTSVHFSVGRDVTTFLDEIFPGLWEERGGPTTWPPRSPDLTALDFFAWGFIKDVVYRRKVRDLADLRQRIIETVELITPHMLINTWQELEYRLYICRATTGAHIEVYGRA